MHTDSLRKLLDLADLELFLSADWSSSQAGHRERIRQALVADLSAMSALSEENRRHLLDLNTTPRIPGYSVSISHCRKIGGYIRTASQRSVGFDVEVIDRVSESVAKKLSYDEAEWREAPSPSSLWVAKEAAFKSLFQVSRQPDVAPQVKVGNWQKKDAITETCEILEIENHPVPANSGCVLSLENVKISCFALR